MTTGNTPSKKDPTNYGDYLPFVKPPELLDCPVTEAADSLSEKGATLARVLPSDSVLVSCIGNLGKTGINRVPLAFNQQINAVVFPEGIQPDYGFYYFQSSEAREYLEAVASATTVTIVNKSKFQTTPFPLPPEAEQCRIVAEIETQFSRLHAAVAALRRAQATLVRYKAAVLKAACEGRLLPPDEVAAIRQSPDYEPADQLLQRILAERRGRWEEQHWQKEIDRAKQKAAKAARKAGGRPLKRGEKLEAAEWQSLVESSYGRHLPKDDRWMTKYKEPASADTADLPELPQGWAWATVQQLAAVEPRSIQSGPFGSSLLHSEFQDSGILAIGIDNVLEGKFSMGRQHRISLEKFEQLARFQARPLDVLITVMATVGRCCVVPADLEPAIVTKHIYRVSPNQDFIDPYYLMFALWGAQEVRRQVFGEVRGQTRPGINGTILKRIAIPVPPLQVQHRTVDEVERQLSIVGALAAGIRSNVTRAERLRQAILKRAFEGRLVPQDPNDEPASALLARIRAQRAADGMSRGKGRQRQRRLPAT